MLLDPKYDQTVSKLKERLFFYFGDELGYLKIWDLTMLLQPIGALPKSHPQHKGHMFLPKRVESIEITPFA